MDFPEVLPEHSKDYNDKQNCDRKFWYLNNKFFPVASIYTTCLTTHVKNKTI